MNKTERIAGIVNAPNSGERKEIFYDKKADILDVKLIPLKFLLYNPYNGRIGSLTRSYESNQGFLLNPENHEHANIIAQFLYDSAKGRNEKTIESLQDKGQQEIGIVTKDGVIIDGNRRAMLLNRLYRNKGEIDYFKAVVLKDELRDNPQQITLLETSYQMGVDSKVDYNPIEKYIRCNQLKDDYGMSIDEIAKLMVESPTKIQDWLNILSLMNEYLGYLGSPGVFTRLEKREGHFVDLTTYLKTLSRGQATAVNWNYSNEDVQNLKYVYFDYVRLGIPVLKARVIARPSIGYSFFAKSEIWSEFIQQHNLIKAMVEEDSFEAIKTQNPESSNEDVFRNLDDIWKESIGNELEDNLASNETNLNIILEAYNPLRIIKRVKNNLLRIDSISPTIENEFKSELSLVKERISVIENLFTQD
jgi:hypothetical protein